MKNILKRILLVILWFFFVMFIIGTITTNEVSARAALAILGGIILLLILKIRSPKKQQSQSNNNELLLQQQLQKISILEAENSQLKNKLNEIGCNDYDAVQKVIALKQHEIDTLNSTIAENNATAERQLEKNQVVKEDSLKLEKKYASLQAKVTRLRYLFDAITQAINDYHDEKDIFALTNLINEADELSPSVILKLHNMDYKDLKKAFNENDKAITQVLEVYEKRYTTKANQSIYQLMVIALRAELQNILYNLKYDKLDKSIDDIKLISAKYLKIAGEGNQSISSTLTRFIGEIEYLFINAAKIEYNYYVKKEQAKQEQAAIREQIRQEAAERKALEAERKRIEQEEAKYTTEIDKLQTTILETTNNDEVEQLKARILELQSHLSAVVVKKEEIVNLQNGKAGNVYIISNLGSFGDNVFKIGMTRRLNPQERIDELGSASVPFKFDVHSFIFSQDAVALESSMHERLNNQRVNKVNLRKEFFNVSIDELERIVNELDPTAEFNKTMLAEEYRQSLSSDENYTSDNIEYGDDEEPFEVNDEIE
jgi:phage protein